MINHLALFNGIGGFQLAALNAGWNNYAHCEIDTHLNQIIAQRFPKSICHTDIKEFDAKPYNGTIDVISGGFPCQPFSYSGKRQSKNDDRYLWPEMLRVINEVKPKIIIGENVAGIIELALDSVLTDLENSGYQTETFIIPACALDAPHRRDRVWIIAYSEHWWNGWRLKLSQSQQKTNWTFTHSYNHRDFRGSRKIQSKSKAQWVQERHDLQLTTEQVELRSTTQTTFTHTYGQRCQNSKNLQRQKLLWRSNSWNLWKQWSTESPVCGMDHGIPKRMDRIKALGNAIVPQIAHQIMESINLLALELEHEAQQ